MDAQEKKWVAKQKELARKPDPLKPSTDPEEILRKKQFKLQFEREQAAAEKTRREGWMAANAPKATPEPTVQAQPSAASQQSAAAAQGVAEAHGVFAGKGDGQGWKAAAASRVSSARMSVKPKLIKADKRTAAEKELETMRARRMRAEELVAAAAARRPSPKK